MKTWLCIICGLIYDEKKGWPSDGIAPGTVWEDVPADWLCPDCLVGKSDFEMIEITPEDETEVEYNNSYQLAAKPEEVLTHSHINPIVIIGSGHSGYQLALALREQSKSVPIVIFTNDDGALYNKPALSNAFAMKKDANSLCKEAALDWESRLNIRLYPYTTVESIDRSRKLIQTNIGSQEYSRLVIAAGASPISIPIHGDCSGVVSVNNLLDYQEFRSRLDGKKKVAILGDGLIGCEFANDLVESGHQVTAIGLGKWPMQNLIPQQLGRALQNKLSECGVTWSLESSIKSISKDQAAESGYTITLTNNEKINADVILSAIGLKPNSQLAAKAGLAVEHGIKVNNYGQTSDEHIFAIGDCAEFLSGWKPYIAPINQSIPALAKSLIGKLTLIEIKPTPIIVKTPIMPLSIYSSRSLGRWEVEKVDNSFCATHFNIEGVMDGFALLGDNVQHLRAQRLDNLFTEQKILFKKGIKI